MTLTLRPRPNRRADYITERYIRALESRFQIDYLLNTNFRPHSLTPHQDLNHFLYCFIIYMLQKNTALNLFNSCYYNQKIRWQIYEKTVMKLRLFRTFWFCKSSKYVQLRFITEWSLSLQSAQSRVRGTAAGDTRETTVATEEVTIKLTVSTNIKFINLLNSKSIRFRKMATTHANVMCYSRGISICSPGKCHFSIHVL